MSQRIKYIFVQERKVMLRFIKKLFLSFTQFSNLISYPQISEKRNIETMLTFPCSYNWQKCNNKMNEKRSQEYQSIDPQYVTGQINSHILELLLRQFFCLIFCTVSKILICLSLIKRFPNKWHLKVSILHRVASINVFLPEINVFG